MPRGAFAGNEVRRNKIFRLFIDGDLFPFPVDRAEHFARNTADRGQPFQIFGIAGNRCEIIPVRKPFRFFRERFFLRKTLAGDGTLRFRLRADGFVFLSVNEIIFCLNGSSLVIAHAPYPFSRAARRNRRSRRISPRRKVLPRPHTDARCFRNRNSGKPRSIFFSLP